VGTWSPTLAPPHPARFARRPLQRSWRGEMRVIGFDPGLRRSGWGVVDLEGTRLRHVGNGVVASDEALSLAERLVQIRTGLAAVVARFGPGAAAVEETFVNKNPTTTLKLGQVRGVVLLVPAEAGIPVTEYTPN